MTDENVKSKFESIPRFLRNHFVVTFSISNLVGLEDRGNLHPPEI